MVPNMNTIRLFEGQGWSFDQMVAHGLINSAGSPLDRMLDVLRESGWTDEMLLQHNVAHVPEGEVQKTPPAPQADQASQPEQPPKSSINVNEKVERFVTLRDQIKGLKDKVKAKTSELEEEQEHIASELGAFLEDTGQDSGKASSGTFFWVTKNSVSMADQPAFLRWLVGDIVTELAKGGCIAQGKKAEECVEKAVGAASLAFLTKAVQKEMVSSYIEEKGTPPPGLNWETQREVQVRRATTTK